jgi:hypothetical protein
MVPIINLNKNCPEIDLIIHEHFFGKTRLLQEALGVTRACVSIWRRRGIPAMRRYHIDAVIRERSEGLKSEGLKSEGDGKGEGDGESKKKPLPSVEDMIGIYL